LAEASEVRRGDRVSKLPHINFGVLSFSGHFLRNFPIHHADTIPELNAMTLGVQGNLTIFSCVTLRHRDDRRSQKLRSNEELANFRLEAGSTGKKRTISKTKKRRSPGS
jgi:hypothetical protein